MATELEIALRYEAKELDKALKLSQSMRSHPSSPNQTFLVRTAVGSGEKINTWYYDLPEPYGKVYGAHLPEWIAKILDADARSRDNYSRGDTYYTDLFVVHYRPNANQVALLDGLRWDGLNYAFMNYPTVFEKVNAELLFRDNGHDRIISQSPMERQKSRKKPARF